MQLEARVNLIGEEYNFKIPDPSIVSFGPFLKAGMFSLICKMVYSRSTTSQLSKVILFGLKPTV